VFKSSAPAAKFWAAARRRLKINAPKTAAPAAPPTKGAVILSPLLEAVGLEVVVAPAAATGAAAYSVEEELVSVSVLVS